MWTQAFNPQNYQWNPWAIPPLIGSVYFLFIGLLVYLKKRNSKLNISFGLMCLSSFMWQFGFTMMLLSKDPFYPMFWNKVIGSGVVFIDTWFYFYIMNMFNIQGIYRKLSYLFFLKSFTFMYLVISSDLILADLRRHSFGYYLVAGRLHPLFLSVFISVCLMLVLITFRQYLLTKKTLERIKIKYMLLGSFIYVFACIDYLPMYTRISIYPFGDIFVIGFISILFYGIARYRLMEIDTVIHRTALWSASVLLLIVPLCLIVSLLIPWLVGINLLFKVSVLVAVMLGFLAYYHYLKPRIDHLFRRRKYDYYRLFGEIVQKIGSELDIQKVISRLLELKNILYIRNEIIFVQHPGEDYYKEVSRNGYERIMEQALPEGQLRLERAALLGRWLGDHQQVLEKEQVDVDPQYESIREEVMFFFDAAVIEVLIPVVMENKVNALVGIGKKENLQAYSRKDIELLENMGRQIGITIDNALHHGDIIEKERLSEELKLGREIQIALLPQESPQVPGLTVEGLMQPAKEIGGDYYDFITLPDKDKLSVVIGDVSGMGVAAGILMAMAKTAIHTLSQEETSPSKSC